MSYNLFEDCAKQNKFNPPQEVRVNNNKLELTWNLPPEIKYAIIINNNNKGSSFLTDEGKNLKTDSLCWE